MKTMPTVALLIALAVMPIVAMPCDPETDAAADAELSPPPCTRLLRAKLQFAESRWVDYRARVDVDAGDTFAAHELKGIEAEVRALREICR